MRLFRFIFTIVALLAICPARGDQPANSAPSTPPGRPADAAARDVMARLRFAPMWVPVPKVSPASNAGTALPVPSAAYSMIWQPGWQEELGLSPEQKKSLLAINAKAVAEGKAHVEQFKKLSPEEQKVEVKAWAGKPAPWRQQFDNDIRRQIEAVLTPKQLQSLKDYFFPYRAIGLLYDAKTRREIGFSPEQEEDFRRVAKERLAQFQKVHMERADKLWAIMTPEQQTELPELVKHQGPTSAVLSLAGDLGFDPDAMGLSYPMLAEVPVRERLGLSAEQQKQLHVVMADSATRVRKAHQESPERLSEKAQRPLPSPNAEADEKKQVEAILTPQQLAMLKEIDFHRQVVLALGYPEKRKTISITPQQVAEMQRLDEQTHDRLYQIDRKMLGRALEILTPHQRGQLSEQIDQRGW